ncbi:putative ribonuclease H-like domain-containing protein [Tanacetum coccineum]
MEFSKFELPVARKLHNKIEVVVGMIERMKKEFEDSFLIVGGEEYWMKFKLTAFLAANEVLMLIDDLDTYNSPYVLECLFLYGTIDEGPGIVSNRELLQGKATKASSTNSFNIVSTPVNAASAPRTSNDVGPSFVPLGGSFPLDVNDFLDDPLMLDLEDNAIFKIQKVWTLVDLPYGKKAIGTKWYTNKKKALIMKDERGIVVRNKARLVAQGYKQEEGIDYDEVFAHVARIEVIGLFFAYASFMNFLVYQLDVKSTFLYGTIEEEVEKALYRLHQALRAWYETLSTYLLDNGFYKGQIDKTLFIKRVKGDILLVQVYVDDIIFGSTKKSLCIDFEQIMHKRFQMSSMGELTFFLGLQVKQKEDGIFISQDKYVGEILKKFGFSSVRTTSTPMETNKALTKDEDGEDVDVYLYRSMIGSLMYLTSSRPDIMFSVCACLRFQVQLKVSHLNAVKRIFRYLRGRPNLALWYPKDSSFILEAFLDSDYAGASLDRKSITGVLWIQNQMLDYGYNFMQTKFHVDNESAICVVKNPVYHSKTKHLEIRHHFIRDSYDKRLIEMVNIYIDNNVPDLLTKAFDGRLMVYKCSGLYTSAIWIEVGRLVYLKTLEKIRLPIRRGYNAERAITTAASLDAAHDSDNIIRTQTMTRSERVLEKPNDSPLSEGHTSGSREGGMEHQFELMANVLDLEKEKDAQAVKILRLKKRTSVPLPNVADEAVLKELGDRMGEGSGSGPGCQETIEGTQAQTWSEGVPIQSKDPPLSTGNTVGSEEDCMEQNIELMVNVPPTPHDLPLLGGNTLGSDEGSVKQIQE